MQVEENIQQPIHVEDPEYRRIKGGFHAKFYYYDEIRERWVAIINVAEVEVPSNRILLRCKYAKQTLTLPFPFHIEVDICYLWGLIAGSAYKIKQRSREICVDVNQEERVQAIAAHLGIEVQITPVKRSRKTRGAQVQPKRYRKIRVKFPFVLFKFFQCLGYNPLDLALPDWLNAAQQQAWVEGYLNSPKMQCMIQKGGHLRPKVRILIANHNLSFARSLGNVLGGVGIHFTLLQSQDRLMIVIRRHEDLNKLAESFEIYRPKVRALFAILQALERNPALRVSLQKFHLTEFQLVLYGTVLTQPPEELEYTLFETTFVRSSNEIRQELYFLDSQGLISYYKKENNKEFLIRSTHYLTHIDHLLRTEEADLRRQLKLSDMNALSFHCQTCGRIVGYTEAMDTQSFSCPQCASAHLKAIDTSRFFHYGRLGPVTYQRNLLHGGIAL